MANKYIFLGISCFVSSFAYAGTLTLSCPHKEIPFTVELAQTPEEMTKGLMFRETLEDDAGMLFLYQTPQPVAMWMKNTPLSLDMIFGDDEGNILALYENTTPYSLATIGPVRGTTHVLEIKGGTIKKQKITKQCKLRL